MRGNWALLRWQLLQAAPAAGAFAVLLAALAGRMPGTPLASPSLHVPPFILSMAVALMLVAPHHPGATAHLILCGFARTAIWRATAAAAILAGLLCGAGVALGASDPVRTVVESVLGHPGTLGPSATPLSALAVLITSVAGAGLGLWTGVRLLNARAKDRLRERLTVIAANAGAAALVAAATNLARGDVAQLAALLALAVASTVFLWRARVIYACVQPLRD